MIDPENNTHRPQPTPVGELPSQEEEGRLLGPDEKFIIQLSPEFDSISMKSYSDPGLDFDVAGKPVAIIRAGGQKTGEYQDYVVVDMRHLPVAGFEQNSFGESAWGRHHTKRELPDGSEGLGDIAIVRPRSYGETYEITPITEIYDSAIFGRQTYHGGQVGPGNDKLDPDIPGEVSRLHFKVYYDHQSEQVIINNYNPTNQTVVYNGDDAPGNPVEWDESVRERAIDRQIARIALESLSVPEDLRGQ